ncbi:hypothetical protein AMAG_07658 [Allomyces macrogynus ATCC 38327]|uniref:DUF4246 domain-containing protein n=1 Tax=Allomyces macrogynus (strain ATCC 38327) TaxID=578462 RepID=A0A0L0SJ86_ALLM3|nr:hypothetical protein AMAG_07658 [Allomyces macrogynus ATCC 38327]|eukprot:KNE62440.1 hypothetical protein AMAG_07658 [Allomyces macrogynus ATCC 38327]
MSDQRTNDALRARGLLPLPFTDRTDDYMNEMSIYMARTLREMDMCALLEAVRDKHLWARKWQDPAIRAKLTAEVVTAAREQNMPEPDWQYVLKELDYQAKHEPIAAAVDNVFVSDDAVPNTVRAALIEQVATLLESVPDRCKDWHPRSNNQVLDLVHPSLFPLVYGRTLVVPEINASVSLDNWKLRLGGGEAVDPPHKLQDGSRPIPDKFVSSRFQWLPADFAVDADGKVTIRSYVNSLHPERHGALYPTLAHIFESALPLLERVLARLHDPVPLRISPSPRTWYDCEPELDEDASDYDERMDEWYDTRIPEIPDPPSKYDAVGNALSPLSLRGRTLKVITKLANIHLTVDNPTYPGGSWHIEGMANEAIVATALYYYDVVNISESKLRFRSGIQGPDYEQSDFRGMSIVYGLGSNSALVQDRGAVTARHGRLVAFPNTYQHQVAPFELVDKTKPGHRKIVAFFLVDPSSALGDRVVSTSRVAPQQAEWVADVWAAQRRAFPPKVPREVLDQIVNEVGAVMTLEEAKTLRLELMDERTAFVGASNELTFAQSFNLCEH